MIKTFIANKDFQSATQEDLQNFYAEVSKGNPNGVSGGNISKEDVSYYLGDAFGDNGVLTDESALLMGFDSAEEAIQTWYDSLTGAKEAWDNMLVGSLAGFKDMSLETASNFNRVFDKVSLGPKGEQAGRDFVNGLNRMVEDLDPEE
jgi:hypothetical protein